MKTTPPLGGFFLLYSVNSGNVEVCFYTIFIQYVIIPLVDQYSIVFTYRKKTI